MKKGCQLLILIVINLLVCQSGFSQSIQKRYVRHIDRVSSTSAAYVNQALPAKDCRVSNNRGDIIILYDESLPDSVKLAITVAKEIWESKLPMSAPVLIQVLFEPCEDDITMITDVSLAEKPLGCPSALASQLGGYQTFSDESPDGIIVLNSNIDWNCNFSDGKASNYNIPTMILRGMARCFGFGSSITEIDDDKFYFYHGFPSFFDNILYNSDGILSSFDQGGEEIFSFVTSENVYVDTDINTYRIYAPKKFNPSLSLSCLEDSCSIMSYSLSAGNISLNIDEATVDILRAIGWKIEQPGLSIYCSDITDNGIGSSYSSHTFLIDKKDVSVSGYKWRFLLRDKEGVYTLISTGNASDFTIDKISDSSVYYVNSNGDLEGKIECDYTVDGGVYSAKTFYVSLELKPTINRVYDCRLYEDQFKFSVGFNVEYSGADFIEVEVEEEYNDYLRVYQFNEPYLAHIETGNMSNLYYSWVTIIVSNKYGSATETMEFEPKNFYNELNVGASLINSDGGELRIQVIDMNGIVIFEGNEDTLQIDGFNSGVYIVKLYNNAGCINIKKVVI